MSLSTHLFRSLFALPLLAVSLIAFSQHQPGAGTDQAFEAAPGCSTSLPALRLQPLVQVPADLGSRLRRPAPACRG